MSKKRNVKKSSIMLVAALSLLVCSFSTAYAKTSYKFVITRGNADKSDTLWKNGSSDYGRVQVSSASAPSYYTTYWICSGNGEKITGTYELKNKAGQMQTYIIRPKMQKMRIFIHI